MRNLLAVVLTLVTLALIGGLIWAMIEYTNVYFALMGILVIALVALLFYGFFDLFRRILKKYGR